ncbi:TPA: ParB N-terminal domain-containing protein [Acinetobacter baumannii]|uniref:ParB/Srx family N-terminal domain-containing protein n=1 Tax=Acinetobacter baumannii TaxID=470 RepID=UPI0002CF009F|nr:ParB/Srx family N-terminal domain-containing protein [Acinetobacter baumannii]AXX46983.1 chromosome partitioning protein ParB [Acinetobacter baumannii]EHU3427506.1 ParB N-terminal domain-containing protein [Acinetobacter baumannii]EJB8376985.1 ParB N-terminal domain-containing protein [Acinetobacter baumannii]EJB8458571.1 ParB N-terminal domain-containing protein [Acinetobacter baumannii]EKU2528603.1 ParB N-terminal domain-containing protein [Acinetobacter baumannii]
MSELKIQMWFVDDVKPYELNAKIHSEEQVAKIAESIARFGWDQPIVVDKNGVIIKGHGRRLAAIKLGLIEVPVLVRDDLNEEQVKAARLADNRVAIGDIDADLLKLELQSINIEFLEDIFDSKELEFMQADLSEMNVDVIVDDLDSAVAEQQRHTANAVSESNEKPIRIDKVLGFSEVSGKESRSIHYFMAIAEDATGLEGKDAFVTYISKLVESA